MESIDRLRFPEKLRYLFEQAEPEEVHIALRAGRKPNIANIVIIRGGTKRFWRVGPAGGTVCCSNQEIVEYIKAALKAELNEQTRTLYEQMLSSLRTGWVVLTVRRGRPMYAEYRPSV